MNKSIRIFIVDDSAVARQINKKVVTEANHNFIVIGTAPNGKIALEKLSLTRYKADVILMDIMMPEMDGIETISHILDRFPTPVIIVSTLSQKEVEIALSNEGMSAFESGAVEFVKKPNISDKADYSRFKRVLKKKISILAQVNLQRAYRGFDFKKFLKDEEIEEVKIKYKVDKAQYRNLVMIIGASTGGPRAISLILSKMAPRFPPVVIVQHMPREMSQIWAKRLQILYPHLRIKIPNDNEMLRQNHVYIAPGGKHFSILSGKTIHLYKGELVNFVIPSVDVTLISAAKVYGNNVLALVLTGMGKDGLEGARTIKQVGGSVMAEHESTAVIYAMPQAVVDANLADEIVPLHDIPKYIRRKGWMTS